MEIVTLLLGAYKVGRALLKGDGADTAVGDLVAAFLGPLLIGQDQSLQALKRIEQATKDVRWQFYAQPMHVGWDSLRDAMASYREVDHRRHLLRTAQREFRAAVAAAPDARSAVDAQLMVAACWIAMGNATDALLAMSAAAVRCREHMYLEAREYAQPSGDLEEMERIEGAVSRLRRGLFSGGSISYDDPSLSAARANLRVHARERRDATAALYNQVQQVRLAYGEKSTACAPVIGFYEPGEEVLSPQHSSTVLRTSSSITNSPVLSWEAGQRIDLVGATVEVTTTPVVKAVGDAYRTEFSLAVSLSAPEFKLELGPDWPYNYRPDPLISSSPMMMGFFWSGAAVVLSADRTFRVGCTTAHRPERIVAQQYGVLVRGERHFLLAAMDL
jgi:hypothetical protein